eukprot:3100331-Pleurochrysis_carterae.AAC.1
MAGVHDLGKATLANGEERGGRRRTTLRTHAAHAAHWRRRTRAQCRCHAAEQHIKIMNDRTV